MAWEKLSAMAPSIFRAGTFGRWVVTQSLDDVDFHDHIPAVFMDQRLLWFQLCKHRALFSFANGSTHFACSAYQNTAHLETLFLNTFIYIT